MTDKLILEQAKKQEFEIIKEFCGAKDNNCECKKCVSMCEHTSCIGTPIDMQRIKNAGFERKLESILWESGIPFGVESVQMTVPRHKKNGECIFLMENRRCELHNKNLKPTEGKLANCKINPLTDLNCLVSIAVAHIWIELNKTNK